MGLIETAGETLFGESAKDLLVDYVELGLDSITESDILKEIPIVRTVSALAKGSMAIKEKFFLKKFLSFIKEFNSGNVDEKEIAKRKNALNQNEEWIKREVEYLVIYIDNMDSIEKARIYAVLYRLYINNAINFERLSQYTEIVNRMLFYDFQKLKSFYHYSQVDKNELDYDITSYNRLIGLGLVDRDIYLEQDTSKYGKVFVDNSYFYRITYSGKFIGKIICELF